MRVPLFMAPTCIRLITPDPRFRKGLVGYQYPARILILTPQGSQQIQNEHDCQQCADDRGDDMISHPKYANNQRSSLFVVEVSAWSASLSQKAVVLTPSLSPSNEMIIMIILVSREEPTCRSPRSQYQLLA